MIRRCMFDKRGNSRDISDEIFRQMVPNAGNLIDPIGRLTKKLVRMRLQHILHLNRADIPARAIARYLVIIR